MPELRKIETSAAYTPSIGEVVEYLAEEEGKLVLKVRKSDGSEERLSGLDTSDATATAADVPSGLIFYGANGRSTGTMPESVIKSDKDGISVSAGYVKEATGVTYPPISVTKDDNAGSVTVGVGYNQDEVTLYLAKSSGLSISGAEVTVGKGHLAEDATLTVPAGSVEVDESINKVIVTEGYVQAQELPFTGGSADYYKCAAVYGPKKVTYVNVAGAGTNAVNGSYAKTDLKSGTGGEVWKQGAGNYYYYEYDGYWCIHSDYNTWGESALYYSWNGEEWYTGYNYETDSQTGESPAPTVSRRTETLDADVPKTWDGYKAVWDNEAGGYIFESEITTGLTYGSGFTPAFDKVYDSFARLEVHRVFKPIPQGTVLLVDFSEYNTQAAVGEVTLNGSFSTTESGVKMNGGYIKTDTLLEDIADEFTIAVKVTAPSTYRFALFAAQDADLRLGVDTIGGTWSIWAGNSGWNILEADSGYTGSVTDGVGRSQAEVIPGQEQTVVYRHSGNNWDLFVDGVLVLHKEREGRIATGGTLAFNRWGNGGYVGNDVTYREIAVFPTALTNAEIAGL